MHAKVVQVHPAPATPFEERVITIPPEPAASKPNPDPDPNPNPNPGEGSSRSASANAVGKVWENEKLANAVRKVWENEKPVGMLVYPFSCIVLIFVVLVVNLPRNLQAWLNYFGIREKSLCEGERWPAPMKLKFVLSLLLPLIIPGFIILHLIDYFG